MDRKLLVTILAASLLLPGAFWAGQNTRQTASANSPASPSASGAQQASAQAQQPQTAPARPQARRRSYERETNGRQRSGISKKEKVFLAAIAGTSMGIGAIAGGGKGLAIGAIVGGWAAYAGHRFWKWIK